MPSLRDLIHVETQTGDPVTNGTITVTPQSQAVIIRWPRGGFVWNRPIGVLVDRDGQIERLPIIDVTRYATWALAGVTLLFSVIISLVAARRRSHGHE